MTEMVERGGVRVDWFEGRGDSRGGLGGGGREGMDEGMELDSRRGEEWERNGEEEDEDEEERRKKARREMLMMRGSEKQEKDADNAEDNMLELRLSLAVAISVPSPPKQEIEQQQHSVAPSPGSCLVHQHQHNLSLGHHNGNQYHQLQHQQQQLGVVLGGRTQSPLKPLMQRPVSPTENHRDSSRANLGATLKHLVSQQLQQQPVKLKSMPRIPGVAAGTPRQPIQQQYGLSPLPQLQRHNPPPLVRSSTSLQDGLDNGVVHFPGMGRVNSSAAQAVPSQSTAFSLGLVGKRQQSGHLANQAHEPFFQKGFPHQSQPRVSAQRNFSRTATAGLPLQSSKEILNHQGQHLGGSIGHSTVLPSSPSSRIFATNSYSPHISAHAVHLPGSGPQLQAFLQHQSSNSVSVASHRQTQSPSQEEASALGKNPSAFSVVRPAISGTVPSSVGESPSRERSADVHVIAHVCDRKVKLTSDVDPTSLYAICRRWLRNDVMRRDQSILWDCPPLPSPSPAAEPGSSQTQSSENRKDEAAKFTQKNLQQPVESMTEKDLLDHHVEHFKNVRKRFRDDRMQRIARFMPRLALLLPVNAENIRRDAVQFHP
ncbi:unnamed protein product [Calypogeia fissa]